MTENSKLKRNPNSIIVTFFGLLSLGLVILITAIIINYKENAYSPDATNVSVKESKEDKTPVSFPKEREGRISEGGLQIDRRESNNEQALESGHSLEGYQKSLDQQRRILETETWSATDYALKDVISKTYIVQLGDTLWEIAEGYYGNGFRWVDILNNNKSSIGFLSNGEQALIIPGQILILR